MVAGALLHPARSCFDAAGKGADREANFRHLDVVTVLETSCR